MENEVQQDGNVESSNEVAAVETTTDQAGNDEAPVTPTDSAEQTAPEATESGEADNDLVTDEAGNKFYPADKLDKIVASRLAKMAEQKNAAVNNVIEAMRNDPEVRKQLLEAAGVEEPASSDQKASEVPESNEFDSFLTSHVPAEHHAHYKSLAESLEKQIERKFSAALESKLSPMLAFIGKQEVKSFASQHPDYSKYSGKIQDMVRQGRAKTLEDAYKIAAWEDKMKGAGAAAIKSEQERKAKLAGTPMRRSPGMPGASKPKFGSFKDALKHNAQKFGMDI